MERTVSEAQLITFLKDDCTQFFIESAAESFKDAIVNCPPNEIEKREHAYFMYHAVQSLSHEMEKMKQEILAKQMAASIDNY